MRWPWVKRTTMELELRRLSDSWTAEKAAHVAAQQEAELRAVAAENRYEGMTAIRESLEKVLRDEIEAERAKAQTLMETIVELKREGFDQPPPPPRHVEEMESLPSDVLAAIEEVAQPGTAHFFREVAHAAAGLGADKSAEDVIEEIRAGGSVNPHWMG